MGQKLPGKLCRSACRTFGPPSGSQANYLKNNKSLCWHAACIPIGRRHGHKSSGGRIKEPPAPRNGQTLPMENPTYITLSRQAVLRRQMDVLANNLANMSTPAFKAESLMVVPHESEIAEQGPRGMRVVSFVKDLATVHDMSEGALFHTDNPLDLAISGDGYFAIETAEGERYTRQGSFLIDGDGQLVTTAGDAVLGENGQPIVLPPQSGEIEVARDGTVSARDPLLPNQNLIVGRLQVVGFENDYELKREANGLYRTAEGQAPETVVEPKVMQGMLEKSNVNGIVEMTRLIETVRSFQSASKVMDQEHERQRKAIETLTRSSLTA